MRSLEEQRREFARGRFLAMPLAGLVAWAVVGVGGMVLPLPLEVWLLFLATGGIVYLGMFFSRFTGEHFLARNRERNVFDSLFFHTLAMALLVYAVAIPFFLVEPTSLPLSVGILSGLMWMPLSWIIEHWIGYFHSIARTGLVTAAWYLFPESRFVAIPAVIVAVYLVTIVVLERRWRRFEAERREPSQEGRTRTKAGVGALLMVALAVSCREDLSVTQESPKGETPFPLQEMTLEAMQQAMTEGTLTSRRMTELYLARIEALDRQGPTLGSVLETNPDALAIADALDRERKEKGARGPLHGVPVLIKDNIDTADRMMTTAGSLALVGPAPAQDAFIVERLRASGAVLLGKTNLSEWANFRSTRSVSGWSARGGLVRNPYALDRSACGSSSGTGAAIAANLAAVGVGTETDGSIICPASTNGLVGIKPTVGLLSRSGIVPISHTQDTPGPMARTVRDAALLLGALAGVDPRDGATADSAGRVPSDLVAGLDAEALRGARLGVLRGPFAGYSPRSDLVLDAAVAKLKSMGAEVLDPVELPHAGEYDAAELEVLEYEFKADLNAYLATRPGLPVKTLADVIAFNEKNRVEEMPHFGQELFLECEKKGPLTEAPYRGALEKARRLSREGIDRALTSSRLDALVALSGGPAWTIDLVNGDHYLGSSTTPAAVSGYPSITVPAGEVAGLPVGVSFFGTAWSEPRLIQLAYAFEQATKARKVPGLK